MLKIDARAVLDVLPAVENAKSADYKPTCYVLITRDYAVATDGYLMLVAKATAHASNDHEAAFLFDKAAEGLLKKAARKGLDVTIDSAGPNAPYIMTCAVGSAIVRRSPADYPAWDQVIPTSEANDQRIGTFDIKLLARLDHLGTIRLVPAGSSKLDAPILRIVGHPTVTGVVMGQRPPVNNKKQPRAREDYEATCRLDHVFKR